MADSLTIRDSLFVRVLRALKLVDVSPDGTIAHSAGADFIPNHPSQPAYDPLSSLSSMAAFPWVYAAVTALATDLSKVEIRVIRGKGTDAEPDPDHPLHQLLEQPSSKVNGKLFFRQVITDLTLTGDAFILIAGSNEPEALLRLHPSRVRINPQQDGQPMDYEYQGGGQSVIYSYDQILHIRSPSWADDPRSLWGVGAIQSLHQDLITDRRTQELTAASAATGRPTGIISPSEEGDRWNTEQIRILRDAYEKQMASGSGLLVMGGALDYTPVGWSPKDMEFSQVRNMTREAVLAALDVPGTRVGLPSANYATSREQAKRYWEGLQGRAAMIDAELTRLARMFEGSDDVKVVHDFSEVDALQESRSDRVNRVMTWVTMGVPVADAASYEGFDDLPTDNLIDPYGGLIDDPPEDDPPEDDPPEGDFDEVEEQSMFKLFHDDSDQSESALIEVCRDVDDREARQEYMRDFIYKFHHPYERAMNTLVKRYFRGQSARIAKRAEEVLPTTRGSKEIVQRAELGSSWLRAILGKELEGRILDKTVRPLVVKMVEAAISQALRSARDSVGGPQTKISQVWVTNQVNEIMSDLNENVYAFTESAVVRTIENALDADKSIGEIQTDIMGSSAFSAERALRVARTETTKTVNAGTRRTYEEMATRGIELEMVWMASPGARDAHRDLDNETAEPGEKFVVPKGKHAGARAAYPGGFGVAALDINCRCTIVSRKKR